MYALLDNQGNVLAEADYLPLIYEMAIELKDCSIVFGSKLIYNINGITIPRETWNSLMD